MVKLSKFFTFTKMRRKKYTAKFKFDRVRESLEKKSQSEVARQHGIGVNMLSRWRQEFIDRGYQIFETTPDQEKQELKRKIARLEQMLGKKEVELGLLKNYVDFYASPDGS
jgi:transposase